MLYLDLETYSDIPISAGVYKYAEHAEILLFAYAIDDEPAHVVDVANGEALPDELIDQLFDPDVLLMAHNSNFDRVILQHVYGDDVGDPHRWRDTMIVGRSLSLPSSLADLCSVLHIPQDKSKDAAGKELIRLFCIPHLNSCGQTVRYGKATHPEKWEHFVSYATLDVIAMREIFKKIDHINDQPQLWADFALDQTINDRGMMIDRELVSAVIDICAGVKEDLDASIQELTGGRISSIGQTAELINFIRETYGYELPDLQKATLERRIAAEDTPPAIKELLVNRLLGSKASVSKYKVLAASTNTDGRLRGCLQFMGASRTGRFSGRLFQPQNLPRGSLPAAEVEDAIIALKNGSADMIYSDLNSVASSCLRGCIVAPAGHKLVVADLSNIEGRVLSWLAGEDWKLDAFRAYDQGTGPDIYKLTYARTFGVGVDSVIKKQRQIGKVLELGMGYGGGAQAFMNYASVYNINLAEMAQHTLTGASSRAIGEAEQSYQYFKQRGMVPAGSHDVFVAIEICKNLWRSANSAIRAFWYMVADKLVDAIGHGDGYYAKINELLHVLVKGRNLYVRLPSGRYMCYPAAVATGRGTFKYFALNQTKRSVGMVDTYGGKITENITQAVARDILVSSMPIAEQAGYKIVLSVHDELITEVPDSPEFSSAGLSAIMSTVPGWASGLPLSAAGFEAYRYKKD